jgi:hypothetical protein
MGAAGPHRRLTRRPHASTTTSQLPNRWGSASEAIALGKPNPDLSVAARRDFIIAFAWQAPHRVLGGSATLPPVTPSPTSCRPSVKFAIFAARSFDFPFLEGFILLRVLHARGLRRHRSRTWLLDPYHLALHTVGWA